jgi:hypothetical protein
MIQGRKLKNRRARNIGIRMGIGQENHCEMLFPRQFQESSNYRERNGWPYII